jgi:predicted ATPase
MHIDQLYIEDFKNLRNLSIDFSRDQTVIIGRNGTGKSNVIEALVMIFRDLDLGEEPRFRYRLQYRCRGRLIEIDADPESKDKKIRIWVDGARMSLTRFSRQPDRRYLPSTVFGYYSGPSNRLEKHFDEHQRRFYRQLLAGADEEPLRPLFYARLIHSFFVLLAFYSFDDHALLDFLHRYLGITSLESVLFVLKQPSWWRRKEHPSDLFWGARGVVRTFLDRLFQLSLAPIRTDDRCYLYLRDVHVLRELASGYGSDTNFFKTLESTYISELIYEVRIRVNKSGVQAPLTFSELSEGEQQLLTVLGLVRFTRQAESLFLLDEPDTHLNPSWKLEYMDLLRSVVGSDSTSQVLLITHDPIVVGGLDKEQVRVLTKQENGESLSYEPLKDPAGMGVDALLTSDAFGLSTSLDLRTQRKLDRKRRLLAKARNEEISPEERQELDTLTDQLREADVVHSIGDPLFQRFVEAMSVFAPPADTPALSKEEQEEQAALARDIVLSLKEEMDDLPS